ncbi:MAG: hypothetical protein IKG26_09155 [Bacillus sp. (in: Bacteria)]|nr:hypothetical protein [Bacillus sp. (in: firmicutes)]
MYDPSEALFQLGLYDYVWGNPGLLQTYNANVQAEKARQEQANYNKMLKQMEDDSRAAEAEKARNQELKEARVEMAKLNKDLINARPQEAVIIRKQQEALVNKYPELETSFREANAAKAEEDAYQIGKTKTIGAIPSVFNTDAEKQAAIDQVIASNLRPEDKEDLIKSIRGTKSTAQMGKEASQSAIAGHTGKKTTEALADQDLTNKVIGKISSGMGPSKLTAEERIKARELGYTWKGTKWVR